MAGHARTGNGAGAVPAPKPLLRGWFHAVAAVAALALTVALCWLSWDDPPKMVSMLIFGLSMIVLYSVSAIYHMGTWRDTPRRVLRSLDHSNIFLLIAGTYTAICFNVLTDPLRTWILVIVWVLAILGISYSVGTIGIPRFTFSPPRVLNTVLYVVMGWVVIFAMPALLSVLPWTALVLLLLGGVLYTIGGIVYARKRPNPFPRVLGFHEIFHLFVVAGGAAFAAVVWFWVLPYPRL